MSIDLPSQVTADVVRITGSAKPAIVSAGAAAKRQEAPSSGNRIPAVSGDTNQSLDETGLSTAVSRLKNHVQQISRALEFTVDKQLDQVIIKVFDAETREVIRQIPAEEVLSLARSLTSDEGVIVNVKA